MKNPFLSVTFIKKLLKGHELSLYLLIIVSVISSFLEITGLTMLLPFLNIIINGEANGIFSIYINEAMNYFEFNSKLLVVLSTLFVIQFIKSGFLVLQKYLTARLVWGLANDWTDKTFHRYVEQDYIKTTADSVGTINHNVITEPAGAAATLLKASELITQSILACFMMISLLYIDIKITAYVFIVVGSICLPIIIITGPAIKRIGKAKISHSQLLNTLVTEVFYNLTIVKSFNLEKIKKLELFNLNDKLKQLRVKGFTIQGALTPAIELSAVSAIILIIYLLTGFDTNMVKETLPKLGTIIIIAQKLFNKTSTTVNSISKIQMGLPSLKLISEQIAFDSPTASKPKDIERLDSIRFYNFSYRFNETSETNRVSFNLVRGKSYAIVGKSGSGKSTIINTLLKLLENYQGEVTVNEDYELRSLDTTKFRKITSIVTQDPQLFSETIEQNIKRAKPSATETDVSQAVEDSSLSISQMTKHELINHQVINQGSNLSGGQKQRVNIARALIREPQLLLLDEFTSALDHETESDLLKKIDEIKKNRIVVLVSHKHDIKQYVDEVITIS